MTAAERKQFWQSVESGNNPLLSVMSGLVEKWGMPAIVMALGDVAVVSTRFNHELLCSGVKS